MQLTEPSPPAARTLTHARLAVLGIALFAAPATLILRHPDTGLALPVVASAVLSVLVLWRMARLVVEREADRRALHERGERQEALAALGLRALDTEQVDAVVEEAARCSTRVLGLDTFAVMSDAADAPAGAVRLALTSQQNPLLVASRQAAWNDEDLAFLQAVANVLAGVLERERTQVVMEHRAVHDALTGLPNRVLILDRLQRALAQARRTGEELAVMFIDLDGFKKVNDEHGHRVGDELLVAVSGRLGAALREMDTLGRLAGDEFVIVCERTSAGAAAQVADRVVTELREPFSLSSGDLNLGASIGVTVSDGAHHNAEWLLQEADEAMYESKKHPGAAVTRFDTTLHTRRTRRKYLERHLQGAIERGELRLAYQPIVAVDSSWHRVVGAEALLRWIHPGEGPISPREFIPIADASGLIVGLGDWVAQEACAQLARWNELLPAEVPFTLFINISARQLADRDFPVRLAGMLDAAGVRASRLGLEVTETGALGEESVPALESLGSLGARLALDDVGTGFSSLTHLKRLDLDLIKIDASFVSGVTEMGEDRAIVRAVTAIARELGVAVVAEGVESAAQLKALGDLGCFLVQGNHVAPPAEAGAIALPSVESAAGVVFEAEPG